MGGGSSALQKRKLLEQKTELLKQTPFFTFLGSEEAISQCAEFFELVTIKESQQLKSAAFIVVVEGELALSTLVPHSGNKKQNVSELLAVKKKGDFFSKAGRELVSEPILHKGGGADGPSVEKVVNAFDFTTVRALRDTTILQLDTRAKKDYLEKHADASVSIEKILNADIKQLLKPVPFLAGVDKVRLSSLAELFTYETYMPGDVVMQEGATDDSFYLVLSGKLNVTANIKSMHEKTLSVAKVVEGDAGAHELLEGGELGEEGGPGDDAGEEGAGAAAGRRAGGAAGPGAGQAAAASAAAAAPAAGEAGADAAAGGAPAVKLLDATASAGRHVSLSESPSKRSSKKSGAKEGNVPVLRPQPSLRLLRKGSSLVNEDINTLSLATIETGSYFGEMGMMVNMPRSATVTAVERCLLAKMKGHEFHNFLKLAPDMQRMLDEDARERMVRKLYAFRLPFFAGILKDKLLELSHLSQLQQCPAGTTLMREGENCKTFFIVIHGLVSVVKGSETVVRLAEGAYFGEISMITGKPHLASVVAHTDVVLLAITKSAFDEFFKGSEELLAEFEMRVLGEKEITLKHLLKHTLGRELFRQHLDNEFSIEHLLFWEKVQEYRQGKCSREYIISEFIGAKAKTPVNVKDDLSQSCLATKPQHYATMFDEIEHEVYALMKRDNFERFKHTKLFQELLDAICVYSPDDLKIDHADLRRAEMSFGRVKAERNAKEKAAATALPLSRPDAPSKPKAVS